ncbi:hypothetical protein HanIR_Chr01g0010721 [Helianthus annuus]|nr:hypothetical protein HanIR_Chr01g0010721 [Helianthus annuus]
MEVLGPELKGTETAETSAGIVTEVVTAKEVPISRGPGAAIIQYCSKGLTSERL